MSDSAAQRRLRNDPRTAAAAAGESLSNAQAQLLLEVLGPDEVAQAVYRNAWGYAVLTGNGLILLRNLFTPKATRVPDPLLILRRAYGMFHAVDILVDGAPHKLHGSKVDPGGELLQARGELLSPDSPLRPGRGRRTSTWVRRHPVLVSTGAAVLFFAGLGTGSGEDESVAQIRAESAVAVADFSGTALSAAVAETSAHPWLRVSAADASSAHRPLKTKEQGWHVCFQSPSHDERVRPSATALTLYAVPEREECPTRLHGARRVMMPDLVGERLEEASRTLAELGLDRTFLFHAHTGKRLDESSRDLSDWTVCRQQPAADTEVSDSTQVDQWLIGPGDPCTEPSPRPKPKPKPKPKPRPEPSHVTTSGGGSTGGTTGGSSSGASTSGGSSSSGSTSGGSSSTSGGSTGGQSGIQFGQFCSPEGAIATTFDGRPAKCFMGKDGKARWGYNSG
ncbi:PASTA domain-containing protein [Streptomyces sp. NPDC048389]|uniref:PASTA domain-containing protein n=1 Tax=Streptomyces sp. NPDC048389 TaxID=3154622 RepID=UPI003455CB16